MRIGIPPQGCAAIVGATQQRDGALRAGRVAAVFIGGKRQAPDELRGRNRPAAVVDDHREYGGIKRARSEEHTSELKSLV